MCSPHPPTEDSSSWFLSGFFFFFFTHNPPLQCSSTLPHCKQWEKVELSVLTHPPTGVMAASGWPSHDTHTRAHTFVPVLVPVLSSTKVEKLHCFRTFVILSLWSFANWEIRVTSVMLCLFCIFNNKTLIWGLWCSTTMCKKLFYRQKKESSSQKSRGIWRFNCKMKSLFIHFYKKKL